MPDIWEHPPPERRGGFTWLTLRLSEGNPEIVAILTVEELHAAIWHATDREARLDLAERLEVPLAAEAVIERWLARGDAAVADAAAAAPPPPRPAPEVRGVRVTPPGMTRRRRRGTR